MAILENGLPCHVNERVNKNITLQQIFTKLNFDNVNQIANEIINSNLLSINTDIKYFWHLLQSHLLYSSNQIYFVPKLIALFLHFLIGKERILGSRIIKFIFEEPNLKENFAIMIPFFYYFDYYNLYGRKEIVTLVFKDKSILSLSYVFIFYFWFAPILFSDFPKMFEKLTERIKNERQCPQGFEIFQFHFAEFSDHDWALHKQFIESGYFPNTIEAALKTDDLDLLISLLNTTDHHQIGMNKYIEPSCLHISRYLQQSPTLIQFSAFFGSRKCFSYLFANGASLDLSLNLTSAHFASAGGCIDIIHDVNSKCTFSDGCLQMAAYSHRNNVFYWIYDKYKSEILLQESRGFLPPIFFAITSNNVELMHFILSQMLDYFDEAQMNLTQQYAQVLQSNLNEASKLFSIFISTFVRK